jgi:hypothetical protein
LTYVALWARAFAVTLAVEAPIAVWLLRDVDPSRLRRLGAALAGNLATHPAVWFILPALGLPHAPMTAIEETWAVVIEMAVYALVFPSLRWSRALGVSALANGASFAVGLLLRSRGLV